MRTASQEKSAWIEASHRFRFAGIAVFVLATVGWIAWFYPYDDLVDLSGTPLGGDYVMLYVAGQAVASGEANTLYDDQRNQWRTNAVLPGLDPTESWPYRYPPTVAACMVPLYQLPFSVSFSVFLALQLLLLSCALYLLRIDCFILRTQSAWLWAIAGCPLVLETLIGGQSSILALATAVAFLHFFRKQRDVVAGAILAIALYKPNVLALVMFASLIARPRLLLGFIPTTVLGFLVALWTCGFSGIAEYVQLATQLASSEWSFETPFRKVHGLAPIFQLLAPELGRLLCVLCGFALSILIGLQWRSRVLSDLTAMALLLATNSLFNPYVPIYDLVLLIAALAYASEAAKCGDIPAIGSTQFQIIAGLLFFGPHISQSLCGTIGVQLFPLVLLAVVLALCLRIARERIAARLCLKRVGAA